MILISILSTLMVLLTIGSMVPTPIIFIYCALLQACSLLINYPTPACPMLIIELVHCVQCSIHAEVFILIALLFPKQFILNRALVSYFMVAIFFDHALVTHLILGATI